MDELGRGRSVRSLSASAYETAQVEHVQIAHKKGHIVVLQEFFYNGVSQLNA